jgi:hypothetical protein
MLKGQRVLTADYFGTILNDAEKEPCVIIKTERQRNTVPGNRWDPPWYYWSVYYGRVAIPWRLMGVMEFSSRMPELLYRRNISVDYGGTRRHRSRRC